MTIRTASVLLTMVIATAISAQESTSLTRSEVAAIKAKLVAVQQAMGGDPSGYTKTDEDSFYLPTDFNPARDGKFWPITSSVQMEYTDEGAVNSAAAMENFQATFQARYAAALASGNAEAIEKMVTEMTQMQTAALSAAMTPPAKKQDLRVNVQLNMNPIVAIDPDAVVLEQRGVIALREKDDAAGVSGTVTVYLDPVALAATEELSKIELRTADDGVTNRTGVFHIVISLDGALADVESWVKGFDFPAMLKLFDPR